MGVIITDGKVLPHVTKFEKADQELIRDLEAVFAKYSELKGRITRVEFDCGMPPVHPKLPRCFRICIPGPDDKPHCTWICL